MPIGPYDFRHACQRLKLAAPEEWETFVTIFGRYTDDVTVAVIEADAAAIMTMKGRAQQCRALLRQFEECSRPLPQAQPHA